MAIRLLKYQSRALADHLLNHDEGSPKGRSLHDPRHRIEKFALEINDCNPVNGRSASRDGDRSAGARIDELHLEHPFAGTDLLNPEGHQVGRKHVVTLMRRRMGIETIYRKRNTSRPHPDHQARLLGHRQTKESATGNVTPKLPRHLSTLLGRRLYCLEAVSYRVLRAQRQYEKIDPENRLVARELERRWNVALQEKQALELRIAEESGAAAPSNVGTLDEFQTLANDLERQVHR